MQIYEPARQSGQLFLVQASNLRIFIGTGGDAISVRDSLRKAIAAGLVAEPLLRFVDGNLHGGGPGNTFGAYVLATAGVDGFDVYPSLAAMLFDVISGPTQIECAEQTATLAHNVNRFGTAWGQAVGGSGSPFMFLSCTSS